MKKVDTRGKSKSFRIKMNDPRAVPGTAAFYLYLHYYGADHYFTVRCGHYRCLVLSKVFGKSYAKGQV